MILRRLRTVGILAALLLGLNIQWIHAQESTVPAESATPPQPEVQISLRPTDGNDGDRFEAEIEPGASASLSATIQNFSAEPLELRVYTVDVAPMANGGLGIRELGSEQHEPTTWMDFSTETVTLGTGEQLDKPFTITVPEGTAPGQYINALILETVDPIPSQEASAFEQYFRKVVSVYITVPGPLEAAFELGTPQVQVQGTSGLVEIPIHNTGNVRIDLAGEMQVLNEEGAEVLSSPVTLGPIYGGQETSMQVFLPTLPPEGTYFITLSLTDRTSQISGGLADASIAMPAAETTEVVPIAFENVTIEPNADPIQFANVSLDIVLSESSYRSTRLTLSVSRNGEHVEDFVLAENLALNQGTNNVQQRYLPATGWESGTYTFSLKLESTDTGSGTATEILSESDVATIEVP